MKKINDLTIKKNAKLDEMRSIVEQVIAENRVKDEDENKRYSALDNEVKNIEAQIREYESLEELNKKSGKPVEVRTEEKQPVSVQFRDWLTNAVKNNRTDSFQALAEFRADPIITTTDADIINKTSVAGIDILTSPAEAFLRQLGVTFYQGLNGNFAVPSMAQDTAVFYGEDASAASANMTPDSLVLQARRVSHTQSISKETLAQTNPGIYAGILQNLVNGVWNAVTNDVFDTLQTDAATAAKARSTVLYINFADVLGLEASLGGLNVNSPAYVTTPTTKAYLKGTAGLTNQVAMWNGNEMNGYPAYGVPAANASHIYFGDFSRMAVGQWNGLEIIVDPYKNAQKGLIDLTIIGLFDTGCMNSRAFSWIADTSVGA